MATAVDGVVARFAKEIIFAAATLDDIVALAAQDAGQDVHARVDRDLVIAGSTIDNDASQGTIVVDKGNGATKNQNNSTNPDVAGTIAATGNSMNEIMNSQINSLSPTIEIHFGRDS